MTTRLQERYNSTVKPALMQEFGYTNPLPDLRTPRNRSHAPLPAHRDDLEVFRQGRSTIRPVSALASGWWRALYSELLPKANVSATEWS